MPKISTSLSELSFGLLERAWSPDEPAVAKSYAGRVIKSIELLEAHGYEWVTAVRSERFVQSGETVARIIAYPHSPGKSAEILKLLRQLGVKDEDQTKYALSCGVHFLDIPQEKLEREIWQKAAEIATNVQTELNLST